MPFVPVFLRRRIGPAERRNPAFLANPGTSEGDTGLALEDEPRQLRDRWIPRRAASLDQLRSTVVQSARGSVSASGTPGLRQITST